MYGIVLMAAVTTGPDSASFGWKSGHGCYGASCVGVSSCYGCAGSVYGCGYNYPMPGYNQPGGAAGCAGWAYGPPIVGHQRSGVAGCYGISGAELSPPYGASCFGLGYTNQYAPMHGGYFGHRLGCDGWGMFGHKHTCHGCFGGGGGSIVIGCSGDPWPFVGNAMGCYGCFGVPYGCNGYGYYNIQMGAPITGIPMTPPGTGTPDTGKSGGSDSTVPKTGEGKTGEGKTGEGKTGEGKTGEGKGGTNPGGASLKFTLPADAKLYVDGRLTNGTGTDRSFFTPPLIPGQKYFYEVKAELMVDGQLVTEEKRVIVEAGAELRETFPKLVAATPANPGAAVAAGK